MTQNEANSLMATYGSKLPPEALNSVYQQWLQMDYHTASMQCVAFHDPTIAIVISVLVGVYGIDRFYVGDVGLGVLKLLTCGGCGIWWIIDLFLIMKRTREKNFAKLATPYVFTQP